MAKLPVVAATLLIALFALAEATTYTTTVTTITTEDESGSSQQGSRRECQEQIQDQQIHQLQQACWSYLSRGRQSLRMVVGKQGQEQQRQECCQQLEKISSPCRCRAIGEMVKRQSQQGQQQHGQQIQEVLERARNLPKECNMQQPQRCQIQPYWF